MSKKNKTFKLGENSELNTSDISSIDVVQNEQVALYFQFDDDEPIEGLKCNGKEFTMKTLTVENGFIEFSDGKKRFRMFVRHCN